MKTPIFLLSLLACIISSCVANKSSDSFGVTDDKSVKSTTFGTFYSLGDYLKRVPGLQYVNQVYQVRGLQSMSESEPLYVVNGVLIGNSYLTASSSVDVNDIESVNVLKDVGSTNKYGMRGSHGVIEIRTKSSKQ